MYVFSSERHRNTRLVSPAHIASEAGDASPSVAAPSPGCVVLVDHRRLLRECTVLGLDALSDFDTAPFASVRDWLDAKEGVDASVLMIAAGGRACQDVFADFDLLERAGNTLPVILIAQAEGLEAVLEIVGRGARAYIPTSMSLEVAIEVVKLVKAGGTYVPASSLMAARQSPNARATATQVGDTLFTNRQAAVVDALRRGKANKIIAYELSMRESTVKVHVRNIMRKLNAKNRTEVAVFANASDAGRTATTAEWSLSQPI